jgi:hypothetical protein
MKKRGPREGLIRHPRPGEGLGDGLGQDVEGHGINDLTRPLDGVTGQPTAGHDGAVHLPRTGGEDIPDMNPDGVDKR